MKDRQWFDQMASQLTSAVLCDILDSLGYRNQAMSDQIAPLEVRYRLFGIARTVLCHDVFEQPENPYEKEIEMIDSIQPNEIAVVCTGQSKSNGFWGELMATAAAARGGRGAIVDGAVRDIRQMRGIADRFQVFAAGRSPLDSKGRCDVDGYNIPIVCGDVPVCPGDYIFGDIDGIVVIPSAAADEAIRLARRKLSAEDTVRDALAQGQLLKDVFSKHKIL